MKSSNACDRCRAPVSEVDDIVRVDAKRMEALGATEPDVALFVYSTPPRHIRCSPSRAQWIRHEDFPTVHDDRREHDRRRLPNTAKVQAAAGMNEQDWTDAWLLLRMEVQARMN